jgi:hypothetical protein
VGLDWVHATAVLRAMAQIALLATMLLSAGGCDSLRMNQGRATSFLAAAQMGAFKREQGSWPTTPGDLAAHGCPGLDQNPREGACQFFATLPYQLVLHPRASDMQVEMRSAAGKLVCRLVIVIPAGGAHALMPQVRLRTTLLTCPGEGKPW